jgi:hypothetical protein
MRWVGHVASMEERRNAYRIFIIKPEGKRPCRRCKYGWEDKENIKMELREIGWEGVDCMHQDRDQSWALVNTAMNL